VDIQHLTQPSLVYLDITMVEHESVYISYLVNIVNPLVVADGIVDNDPLNSLNMPQSLPQENVPHPEMPNHEKYVGHTIKDPSHDPMDIP
jgi:hypothetical protein